MEKSGLDEERKKRKGEENGPCPSENYLSLSVSTEKTCELQRSRMTDQRGWPVNKQSRLKKFQCKR